MYYEEIKKVSSAAQAKGTLLKGSPIKYLLSSVLAGMYVGLGILLIFTIGGLLSQADSPAVKIIMGTSFGIALSLVIMAGSELFTGNNMIMTIAVTPHANQFGLEFINMGSMAFLEGVLGRAMSPITGATIICAGIAGVNPIEVAKRNTPV